MKQLLLSLFLFYSCNCQSQQKVADSLPFQEKVPFKGTSLLLPLGLMSYGILGIKNDPVRKWDRDIRKSLHPNGAKTMIDDYIMFSPIAATYGLDLLGIKGRNNMLNKSIILGTATLLLYSSVNIVKNNTNIRRPSGRSQSSFPSGHTAISFMAAEFLHQEYGHESLWYSIAGYSIATTTGFLRIYNDKHWFSDILAGAGIGILSTKIAYWLYPLLKNVIFKNRNKTLESQVKVQFTPLYTGNELLLATSLRF